MSDAEKGQSTVSLIGSILKTSTELARNEIDLALAEFSQGAKSALGGVGFLIGALLVAIVSLNVLTGAIISSVVRTGLTVEQATWAVGVTYAVIAGILFGIGFSKLRHVSLLPKRTMHSLAKDAVAVKDVVR